MNESAASQSFTVEGKIDKYATIPVDAINWFNSGEFARAYHGKDDNNIWDPMANGGNWNSFFNDQNGSLSYRVAELVLVSGYDITVTSEAQYSQQDLEVIRTDKTIRVWPFYSHTTTSEHTIEFSLNESSQLGYCPLKK